MGFKDEMEQYDEQWTEDQARTPGIIPDGKHTAQVVESRVEQNEGRYSWVIRFAAEYPNDAGEIVKGSIRKWSGLDNEIGRSIAAQDAKRLGYDGPLSGLEEACMGGMFDDLVCEINVKTKAGQDRDYTNVYINRVLGKGDPYAYTPVGPDFSGSSADDDDIPF